MEVAVLVLNAKGEPHFKTTQYLKADTLMAFAKDREQLVRKEGADWTTGLISFYGQELVKAVKVGENKDVDMAVMNMVMAAWLFDSVFCGITADTYRRPKFEFVITDDGIVSHKRIPTGGAGRCTPYGKSCSTKTSLNV